MPKFNPEQMNFFRQVSSRYTGTDTPDRSWMALDHLVLKAGNVADRGQQMELLQLFRRFVGMRPDDTDIVIDSTVKRMMVTNETLQQTLKRDPDYSKFVQ